MDTTTLEPRIKGNTSNAINFTFKVNDVVLDLTGAKIYCKFRRGSKLGAVAKYVSTESEGGITVADPTTGIVTIDEFLCDFEAGNYVFDVKIVFPVPNARTKTWVGGVMVVEQNVTY
jgi:hypothetical protein